MNLIRLLLLCLPISLWAQDAEIGRYDVLELSFEGPTFTATDNPVRDVRLTTTWRHASGSPTYTIEGFYDGDGQGGPAGNVFRVRFTPTRTGIWTLTSVTSNREELKGQQEGFTLQCLPSDHPGFWQPDPASAGGRWYMRSDGSHPYILGNTMYTFLSEYTAEGPNGSDIRRDIRENAKYYNKLRFALTGDLYPHPTDKPWLDEQGQPTDDGNFSHRPNPKWFNERVDLAVEEAYDADLIADLILNGPDSPEGRSNLMAAANGNDPTPFLRYIAARYGSYPNVWICLSNEYNIRRPRWSEAEVKVLGHEMRALLPYGNPLSIHPNQQDWDPALNTLVPWNDHVIFQNKLKRLWMAADITQRNYLKGGSRWPVINDELAYQGAGDDWTEEEVLVAFLGTFLGGGYGSTGDKPGSKLGGYFAGNFNLDSHSASDNLGWFREQIDADIQFWTMEPINILYARPQPRGNGLHIFHNVAFENRLLGKRGAEYVFGGSGAQENIRIDLPEGTWTITLYDLARMEKRLLSTGAQGEWRFDLPETPAVFVHVVRTP